MEQITAHVATLSEMGWKRDFHGRYLNSVLEGASFHVQLMERAGELLALFSGMGSDEANIEWWINREQEFATPHLLTALAVLGAYWAGGGTSDDEAVRRLETAIGDAPDWMHFPSVDKQAPSEMSMQHYQTILALADQLGFLQFSTDDLEAKQLAAIKAYRQAYMDFFTQAPLEDLWTTQAILRKYIAWSDALFSALCIWHKEPHEKARVAWERAYFLEGVQAEPELVRTNERHLREKGLAVLLLRYQRYAQGGGPDLEEEYQLIAPLILRAADAYNVGDTQSG